MRPDFLFLRIVARTLVLWDSVEATDIWVNDQIPSVIINSYHQMIKATKTPTSLADLANFAAMSMSEMSDEKSTEVQSHSLNHAGSPIKPIESEHDTVPFDRQAIRQSYVYIISGICFSLGLRFAGTGDAGACKIIYKRAIELQKLRDDNDPVSLVLRPERPVIEMCLGSIAISLGMVMSGTGDLKTFGLFKALRWKCDDSVKYGNHMAYSAAIGLLFLGGGSCIIGNDPEDVAALVCIYFHCIINYRPIKLSSRFTFCTTTTKKACFFLSTISNTYARQSIPYASFTSSLCNCCKASPSRCGRYKYRREGFRSD